jgi:hypothetical protein
VQIRRNSGNELTHESSSPEHREHQLKTPSPDRIVSVEKDPQPDCFRGGAMLMGVG